MATSKIAKLDSATKALVSRAFPAYRGRKFSINVLGANCSMQFDQSWSGGSRSEYVAVELSTGRIAPAADVTRNPYSGAGFVDVSVPAGFVILEHAVFQGYDCGITFHVRPDMAAQIAPAAQALPAGR